jgi:hemerythrin superfamily protein
MYSLVSIIKIQYNMKLTKNGIDIRNVVSLNLSGMYFDEFVAYHQMVVERKNAEITAVYTQMTALNDKISALNDSKYEALHKLIEALSDKDTKTVHRMLKANFSIEQIAELVGFSIGHVKELAEAKLEQNDSTPK